MRRRAMATFSVIIPVYNIENYLKCCLDSIHSQTYTDLEIILVDDGSTDSCPFICDEYADLDPRVRVIHKSNGGLVSARKAGAEIASAEYVACIDGDDWIEIDYFERFAEAIEKYSADIICCGAINHLKDGRSYQQKVKERFGYYSRNDIEKMIFPHLIRFSNNIWGKVFKKNIYTDIQLSVNGNIKMAEDACVVIPCVYRAKSMYIMENNLYNYRYNPASMTKGKVVYNLEEPKLIAKHFAKYIDIKQDVFNQQIYRSTIHRLFNRCVSQFYQEKPFLEICRNIDSNLDDEFYQECISKSQIDMIHSTKEWLAYQALKNRMYWVMKLYGILR